MTLELCNTYYYSLEKITSKAFYHVSVKTNCLFFFFLFFIIIIFFIAVGFVIHWNETAMGLHVFPIPILPLTSLSTRSL